MIEIKSENIEFALKDEFRGHACDFSSPSNVLLVIFGGHKANLPVPQFEFYKFTQSYNVKIIYFRDLDQVWYQRGVRGLCRDIAELSDYLKNIKNRKDIHRIVLLGNSMGGFAALLLGCLINADEVIAISPQTFVCKSLRFWYGERRWRNEIDNIYKTKPEKAFLDVKKVFRGSSQLKGEFHIYYSDADRRDAAHAERFRSFLNIKLHCVRSGGHNLIRQMRADGSLETIISQSLKIRGA